MYNDRIMTNHPLNKSPHSYASNRHPAFPMRVDYLGVDTWLRAVGDYVKLLSDTNRVTTHELVMLSAQYSHQGSYLAPTYTPTHTQ